LEKKPFSIHFPEDCTELTGVRRCEWKSQVTDLVVNGPFSPSDIPKLQDCTVFFHWPTDYSFLSIGPAGDKSDIHRDGEAARQIAVVCYRSKDKKLRVEGDNWFAYRFGTDNARDAGPDESKEVSVVISIDTAHEQFRAHAEERSQSQEPLVIDIDVDIAGAKSNSQEALLQRDKAVLKVTVQVRRLEPYDGVVAIDFGNTNSTLIACDDRKGVHFIPCDKHVVEGGQSLDSAARSPTPTPTVLELLEFTPPPEHGAPGTYRINYGTAAVETDHPARLITGAKRMLADMPETKSTPRSIRVLVGDEPVPVPIPSHEPAEIFISQMFEAFLYFKGKEPKTVAITCPSTFTEAEANRTRIATINGLRRALRQHDKLHLPESSIKDQSLAANTVRPCLDESTAAAFWFIHEEVLERRGRGAIEFQYLFPKGMNVLIYDCGGGTTDISLVNVGYESGRLKIKVVGRRGHRTFGGDFITLQYARYLKYQFYARAKGESDDNDLLTQYFAESSSGRRTRLIERVDSVFPTLFDRDSPLVGATAAACARAWSLWTLAERLKCEGFEVDDEAGVTTRRRASVFQQFFGQITRERLEDSQLYKKLGAPGGFEVDKDHIRLALAPVLDKTIRYANDLLADLPRGEEVHRVYLVGNASRCPIISERMLEKGQHGLSVRFLDERLIGGSALRSKESTPAIALEDLKNCVAKGAAVAISIQNLHKAIADWDEDFMKRLPYNIEYQGPDPRYNPLVLFPRNDVMDKPCEAKQDIVLHASGSKHVQDSIRLSRRWPGASNEELEDFLVFRFPQSPVEGRYRVSFDGKGNYWVKCQEKAHKTLVAKGEPIVFPPTVPPSQSGEF
jgi:hypothetical protein